MFARLHAFGLVLLGLCADYSWTVEIASDDKALSYLHQFGYQAPLPVGPVDENIQHLTQRDELSETLKEFQRRLGLHITGKLDNDTRQLMQTPRCGNPDNNMGLVARRRRKRYALHFSKWQTNHLTFKIMGYSKKMDHFEQDVEIEKSLKVWSEVSKLQFIRKQAGLADIAIRFASGNHGDANRFDGPSGVLAHAYFPRFGGNAHFDEDENWTRNTRLGTNLFMVASHEFGHSLGLQHSSVRGSLMFPYYGGYNPNYRLHEDDIRGIQNLYGSPDDVHPTYRPPLPPIQPRVGRHDEFCRSGGVDAIVMFEDDTYAFRDSRYVKLNDLGIVPGYPRNIQDDFPGAPSRLDTALYWPATYTYRYDKDLGFVKAVSTPSRFFIFKDRDYWEYTRDGTTQSFQSLPNFPRRIVTDWKGLPEYLDGAFVWSGNGKTYFIKGKQYYRYTKEEGVDGGYPRPLAIWSGLPSTIDSCFQWKGRTYFFKDQNYYRFYDHQFRVDYGYPRRTDIWWLGCKVGGIRLDRSHHTEMMEQRRRFEEIPSDVSDTASQSANAATVPLSRPAAILVVMLGIVISG